MFETVSPTNRPLKPLEVPSAFFLADTFKYLDAKHLKGKLLKPDKKLNEDKAMLAGREGLKAKRMIGALRYLWRSSPNACDWRVQDLKDLLQKSPERPQRVPPPENPVPRNLFSSMFWCFFQKKSQTYGKVSRADDDGPSPPHDDGADPSQEDDDGQNQKWIPGMLRPT